jgi:hypothetical protein
MLLVNKPSAWLGIGDVSNPKSRVATLGEGVLR